MSYNAAQIKETFGDLSDSELRSRVRQEWGLSFPPRLSREKMESKIAEYLNEKNQSSEGVEQSAEPEPVAASGAAGAGASSRRVGLRPEICGKSSGVR